MSGKIVHVIQARKALEEPESWQPVRLVDIGNGVITLSLNGTTTQFRCDDSTRLREVYTTGRVPISKDGIPIVLKANYGVLIVPCADAGSSFPPQAKILSSISYIEDGAAQYSPTDNGAWHLFAIGDLADKAGVRKDLAPPICAPVAVCSHSAADDNDAWQAEDRLKRRMVTH